MHRFANTQLIEPALLAFYACLELKWNQLILLLPGEPTNPHPLFSLSTQIAQEFDAQERALLGETAEEAGEHGNVDASGMFSVQVSSGSCASMYLVLAPSVYVI